jgi:ketosteroid isomerase-like protein
MDNEAAVRAVVEAWARAVREADMAGVLAHHSDDVVMFDVPGEATGLDAYRRTWDVFFAAQGQGAFDLGEETKAMDVHHSGPLLPSTPLRRRECFARLGRSIMASGLLTLPRP